MTTSEQQGAPTPGWYVHPQTGQPAWWSGAAWTAAPAPPVPAPAPVPMASPAVAVNQFGFPADSPGYAAHGGVAGTTYPRASVSRSGSGIGTWLVAVIVGVALVGGGFFVMRGLGKTAQSEANTAQSAIARAHDTEVEQALINASQAMETWFTDHQNYAVQGPIIGLSSSSRVEYSLSPQGYCLRAHSLRAPAQGSPQTYLWYDSQGGGLQSQPSAAPPQQPNGACLTATNFVPLN